MRKKLIPLTIIVLILQSVCLLGSLFAAQAYSERSFLSPNIQAKDGVFREIFAADAMFRDAEQSGRTIITVADIEKWCTQINEAKKKEFYGAQTMDLVTLSARKDYTKALNNAFFWYKLLKLARFEGETVLELCPGTGYPVPLALTILGFQGHFSQVDIEDFIVQRMQAINGLLKESPNYEMYPIVDDLFSFVEETNVMYDAILGNHVIDDLFIGDFCFRNNIDFFSFYSDDKVSKKVWAQAIADSNGSKERIVLLARKLYDLLNPGGIIVFKQHPSTFASFNKDMNRINFVRSLFEACADALESMGLEKVSLPNKSLSGVAPGVNFAGSTIVFRKPIRQKNFYFRTGSKLEVYHRFDSATERAGVVIPDGDIGFPETNRQARRLKSEIDILPASFAEDYLKLIGGTDRWFTIRDFEISADKKEIEVDLSSRIKLPKAAIIEGVKKGEYIPIGMKASLEIYFAQTDRYSNGIDIDGDAGHIISREKARVADLENILNNEQRFILHAI